MNYTGDVLNFGMAVEKARAGGGELDLVSCSGCERGWDWEELG